MDIKYQRYLILINHLGIVILNLNLINHNLWGIGLSVDLCRRFTALIIRSLISMSVPITEIQKSILQLNCEVVRTYIQVFPDHVTTPLPRTPHFTCMSPIRMALTVPATGIRTDIELGKCG